MRLAKECDGNVEFSFNDQELTATPTSNADEMAAAFMAECERQQKEWQASPEYKKQEEEWRLKQERKYAELQAALAEAPAQMSFVDEEGWKKSCEKNKDPYGNAVMVYADKWARLMEVRINRGEKLADVADHLSHVADNDGLTGFMYGCAVSILAKVWKHGDELRRWHNLNSQLGTEGEKANANGGVLNPAMLVIGEK